MPYKDRVLQKEAVRKAVQKHRGITQQGITETGITQYHPILYALTDPIKRKKLEAICEALSKRNLQSQLFYGCGRYSMDFSIVEDLLEATS